MKPTLESFEGILTYKQPDEFVFLDSCVLMFDDFDLQSVRTVDYLLEMNSGWFVTPSVRREYRVGIDGLKKMSKQIERNHLHDPKNYGPLKETGLSKEVTQARQRLLSLIGREAHNPFNENYLAPQTLKYYEDLIPKVRNQFMNYSKKVHPTDVDLISICLAHALDGRKVIMASADRALMKTFCDGTRALAWRLQRGPKIVTHDPTRLIDYAHLNYKH